MKSIICWFLDHQLHDDKNRKVPTPIKALESFAAMSIGKQYFCRRCHETFKWSGFTWRNIR